MGHFSVKSAFVFAALSGCLVFNTFAVDKNMLKALEDDNLREFKQIVPTPEAAASQDEFGKTPLHYAAWFNRKDMADYLLATQKANINAADVKGETPLHLAAWKNYKDMCKYLISKGANADAVNSYNQKYTDILNNYAGQNKFFNSIRMTAKENAAIDETVKSVRADQAKRVDKDKEIIPIEGYNIQLGNYINAPRGKSVKFFNDHETGKPTFIMTVKGENGNPDTSVKGLYNLEGEWVYLAAKDLGREGTTVWEGDTAAGKWGYLDAKNNIGITFKIIRNDLLLDVRNNAYYAFTETSKLAAAAPARQAAVPAAKAPAKTADTAAKPAAPANK